MAFFMSTDDILTYLLYEKDTITYREIKKFGREVTKNFSIIWDGSPPPEYRHTYLDITNNTISNILIRYSDEFKKFQGKIYARRNFDPHKRFDRVKKEDIRIHNFLIKTAKEVLKE